MPPEEDEVELTVNEIKVAKTSLNLMIGLIFSFAEDPETAKEAAKMVVGFEKECGIGPDDLGLMTTATNASKKLSSLIGDPE